MNFDIVIYCLLFLIIPWIKCIAQDSSGPQFNKHISKQQKRQKSNIHGGIANGILFKSVFCYTQSLIEWAGCTMEFDEIVVVLEVCNTAVISFFDFALVVSKFCAID